MNNRNPFNHGISNTISGSSSKASNTTPFTIATKRHFKINKRSNDNSTALQCEANVHSPKTTTNKVQSKPAGIDLKRTTTKNFSSRNMLRTSQIATSTGQSDQDQNSMSANYGDLLRQSMNNPDCYTSLTIDSFTYETENHTICLLCGIKNVREGSIDEHIDSEYHRTQYKTLDSNLLNQALDRSSLQMDTMRELCDKWYKTFALTEDHMRNYATVEFERILGSINPECQIRIYGSSYYGAATRDSDINIELNHPNSKIFECDVRSKKSIHHKLIDPDAEYGDQINQHTMHYDLAPNPVETLYKLHRIVHDSSRSLPSYPFNVESGLSDLNRKIPSITLKHLSSGYILNITCYSERKIHLAELLRIYMQIDERLERLCVLIKVWAKYCGIDNPEHGSYPPYAYVILMIHFLQRTSPPVLPCLHELVSRNMKSTDNDLQSSTKDPMGLYESKIEANKINGARDDYLEDEYEDVLTANIDEEILRDLKWNSENKSPVHQLFIEFFRTMNEEFSRISNVISIRTLEPILSTWSSQVKAIENPINPRINISRCITSMKTFDFIKDSFFHSYFYFTSVPIDKDLKARKIFKSDPRDYINLYIDTQRFDSYRRLREPSLGLKPTYNPVEEMIQQKLFDRDVEARYALSTMSPGVSLPQTLANLYDPNFLHPQNISYSFSCWFCRSTGHTRQNCPKGIVETLHSETEYDFELDQKSDLDFLLMHIYEKGTISRKLSLEHNAIVGILKRAINEALDLDLNLVLYGSTVNNLGSCDSDLDICVTVKDNPTGRDVDCVKILQNIQRVLETIIDVHDIQPVFAARVPIIRFKFGSFDIDMSMYNQCAIYNSKLLKAYSLVDRRVSPLCFFVKKIAKACGIADASKGSLSSYAWSLMVIYYLQSLEPPILPVLQEPIDTPVRGSIGVNGWNVWFHDKPVKLPDRPASLTQLLKGFFMFYGVFNFETDVISIRKSTRITKYQKSWNGCIIAIEDPFELTYNLANRLSDPMAIFILNFFAQTYRHIVNIQESRQTSSHVERMFVPHRLAKRLFNGMAITKVGPPLRGCLICHKIGHKIKECPDRRDIPKRQKYNFKQHLRNNMNGPN